MPPPPQRRRVVGSNAVSKRVELHHHAATSLDRAAASLTAPPHKGKGDAASTSNSLISLDNPPDDRVADHVRGGEADHVDTFHAFEAAHRVGKPALRIAAGNIDLPGIAANHHAAVLSKPGEEHLHLRGGGVLRTQRAVLEPAGLQLVSA